MFLKIYHPITKATRQVTELDDLLFQDGWRFGEVISPCSVLPFEVDAQAFERTTRIEMGYSNASL